MLNTPNQTGVRSARARAGEHAQATAAVPADQSAHVVPRPRAGLRGRGCGGAASPALSAGVSLVSRVTAPEPARGTPRCRRRAGSAVFGCSPGNVVPALSGDASEPKRAKPGTRGRPAMQRVSAPDRSPAAAAARGTQAPQAGHLQGLPNRGAEVRFAGTGRSSGCTAPDTVSRQYTAALRKTSDLF